ncbi:hypothetical protein JCM12296A_00650 [Desulfosarcina cetonica]
MDVKSVGFQQVMGHGSVLSVKFEVLSKGMLSIEIQKRSDPPLNTEYLKLNTIHLPISGMPDLAELGSHVGPGKG